MGNAASTNMAQKTPPSSPSRSPVHTPEQHALPDFPLTYVRANAAEEWVSIEDALEYCYPDMTEFEKHLRMERLPRICQIYAFVGCSSQKTITPGCLFKAIKWDNLEHLFSPPSPGYTSASDYQQKIAGFIAAMKYVIDNGQDIEKFPMLLIKDSRKTAKQVRCTYAAMSFCFMFCANQFLLCCR